MNSTITLYWNCLLEKEKNFILDNNGVNAIETYLQSIESLTIEKFQYIKQALSLTIKIDWSQSYLEMGNRNRDLNYIKIQNGEEHPCYYFIISKIWKSMATLELVLSMDTLNTFQYDDDYEVSPKTLVKRMHKDRFTKVSGYHYKTFYHSGGATMYTFYFDSVNYVRSHISNMTWNINAHGGTYTDVSLEQVKINYKTYIKFMFRAISSTTYDIYISYEVDALLAFIDLKSEEINVPTYKTSDLTIYETKQGKRNDWSLYYKSADNQETTPIDCFLVPENAIDFKYQGTESKFTNGNVPSNKYLVFSSTYPNGELTFNCGGDTYTITTYSGEHDRYKLLAIQNDGGTIKVYGATFVDTDIHGWVGSWTLIYTGDVVLENAPEKVYSYEVSSLPTASQWGNGGLYNSSYATHETSFTAYVDATLQGHESIDKSLSTNVKIINLPYSPTPYDIDDNNIYTFDACWTYNVDDERLKLSDFNKRWVNEIDSGFDSVLLPMIYNTYQRINIEQDASRQLPDPKLYHSDYYRPKFVYDSFTKLFPLEKVDYTASNKDANFKFDFIMSRNIVSKFLFKFNQIKYTYSNEDYDNIVAVSRNNEEVLYNSQYLDYIRTGYNYDLKAKERQETASGIGIGLNIAGLIASIGLSFVPGGQAIGIGSAIASTLGLAGQLVNYAKTTAQNEENVQRKLQETQMQGVSVMNADDYDLLYSYSENKAKYCIYECSPQMRRVLDDLFFYCGYVINEQMKPNVNTRRSFNFVQASLVINHTNNLTNEVMDDIKEKFDQGVTFLHYSFNKFDFNQDKENIERSLL